MISIGTVFRGSVPHWGQTAQIWIRVLAFDRDTVRLRITPIDATIYSQVWVERSDLEFAMTAGLVEEAPQTIQCETCGGRMRQTQGVVGRMPTIFWACRECEEVKEI